MNVAIPGGTPIHKNGYAIVESGNRQSIRSSKVFEKEVYGLKDEFGPVAFVVARAAVHQDQDAIRHTNLFRTPKLLRLAILEDDEVFAVSGRLPHGLAGL